MPLSRDNIFTNGSNTQIMDWTKGSPLRIRSTVCTGSPYGMSSLRNFMQVHCDGGTFNYLIANARHQFMFDCKKVRHQKIDLLCFVIYFRTFYWTLLWIDRNIRAVEHFEKFIISMCHDINASSCTFMIHCPWNFAYKKDGSCKDKSVPITQLKYTICSCTIWQSVQSPWSLLLILNYSHLKMRSFVATIFIVGSLLVLVAAHKGEIQYFVKIVS